MLLKIIFYIIFKLKGWRIEGEVKPEIKRCVLLAVPHTSNWDIVFASAAFYIMKIPLRWAVKKEWFRFPFGAIIRSSGGIPIDRSPKVPGEKRLSTVEAMAHLFQGHQELAVLVTPEGTRKRVDKWKTGYWYTAKEANVPIVIGYLDYKHKRAGIGPTIWPSNLEEDMKKVMEFSKTLYPRYPEKFALDTRYSTPD